MMRTTLWLVAVLALGPGFGWAGGSAKLGLPVNVDPATPPRMFPSPGPMETLPPPIVLPSVAPPPLALPPVAPPPVLDPRLTPAGPPMRGGPTVHTVIASDPHTGQPYLGYPTSYPSAPPGFSAGAPVGAKVMPMPASGSMGMPPPPADPRGVHQTGPCGPIADCLSHPDQCGGRPGFLDSFSVFIGLDGAHEPIDLGINSRFGYRLALNWGLPLVPEWNLGLHLGMGYNFGFNEERVLRQFEASRDIHQFFFTFGLFQRTDFGFNWEWAWDFRSDDYYEHMDASQWRGLVSYYVNARNELGLWGTVRDRIDRANLGPIWFNVKPINQINLFWRHMWDNQIVTSLWVGIADEHGRVVATRPGEPAVDHPFIFGFDMFVPLSDRLALWGEAQFITPNDSGVVTATLGFAWFPFGRPAAQPGSPYSPLLPVANNQSFSLDAQP